MEFRLADRKDLPQLKAVYKEIINHMDRQNICIWDEIYPCEFFCDDIENNRLYVLTENGDIVSAFALCESNAGETHVKWKRKGDRALYIDRFGVNVNYLRKGIGSVMLKKAIELAKEKGAGYLRLFVVDENVPAIKLYEKCGFVRAGGCYDEVIDEDLVLHEFGYEIETIRHIYSISKLKLISQGNTAEVYLYDQSRVLKLFRENMPIKPIMAEYGKTVAVSLRLQNVPKVYDMVLFENRYGIIYERIIGIDMIKEMLTKAYKIKAYSKLLAQYHSELHKLSVDTNLRLEEKLSADIDASAGLTEFEKHRIKRYIYQLPKDEALCHLDFHPGNIMLRNGAPVAIDWMTACTGNSNADVARTCLLLQFGELQHANWAVRKLIAVLKKYIGDVYYDEYCRITGKAACDIEQWMLPVAAARLSEWIPDHEKAKLLRLVRDKLALLEDKA